MRRFSHMGTSVVLAWFLVRVGHEFRTDQYALLPIRNLFPLRVFLGSFSVGLRDCRTQVGKTFLIRNLRMCIFSSLLIWVLHCF